jgi:hypothetical protein
VEAVIMDEIVPAQGLEAKIRVSNDIGELKEIHDKAEAIRSYVRKAGESLQRQNEYAEVKVRVERRCGEILHAVIEHGGDRKSESRLDRRTLKELGISKYQSHCWQTIAKWPVEHFEAHVAKAKDSNRELTSVGIYRSANDFLRALKVKQLPIPGAEFIKTPIRFKLINDDFMNWIDQFENVDAIVTDPPYGKQDIPLYGQLAEFAAKVLKPGGSLLAMAGVSWLPQVLELMTPHLEYHWAIACHMPGEAAEMWHRKVRCTWKPFLWFTKGSYEGKWVNDVARSDAPEKGLHPWQQSESLFEGLIEQVTEPGQLILDTFFL